MACSPVRFDKTMSPCLDSPMNIQNVTSFDAKVPPIPIHSDTNRITNPFASNIGMGIMNADWAPDSIPVSAVSQQRSNPL